MNRFEFILIVVMIVLFIVDIVTTLIYLKAKKNKSALSYDISNDDVWKLVMDAAKAKVVDPSVDFIDFVANYIKEDHSKDLPLQVEDYVQVVGECEGFECPCSPQREDCCDSMTCDGKCMYVVNLTKLCDVNDTKDIPKDKLLTKEEVDQLAKAIVEYNKENGRF